MEDYGQEDAILLDFENLIYGKPEISKTANTLFFIGPSEYNLIPGTGKGERNNLKKDWREIRQISQTGDRVLWRQIFSNHFDSHPIYKSKDVTKSKATTTGYKIYPFQLDGLEWISVIHYLLFKLYSVDLNYAILFSLESKEDQNYFWGKLDGALAEHKKNIASGAKAFAEDFMVNLPSYIYHATLAKISQNPDLKNILLATGEAYIAERILGGTYEIGKPILMKVRSVLRENPDLVHLNTDQQIEEEVPVFATAKIVSKVETFNDAYNENGSIAGKLEVENIYSTLSKEQFSKTFAPGMFIRKEPIDKSLRWIYMLTKPVMIGDPGDFLSNFDFTFSLVERHVYGMTRNFDKRSGNLIIGYEKFVTTKTKLYLKYQTEERIYYFEPLVGNQPIYSLFVITKTLDDSLVGGFDTFQFYNQQPSGYGKQFMVLPELEYTDSQQLRLQKKIEPVEKELSLSQAYYQFERIAEFLKSKRIQSFNFVVKNQINKVIINELVKRSYINGEVLLQAPGSSFAQEFSSRFGLDLRFVKSYFQIENYPEDTTEINLPNELSRVPEPSLTPKEWIFLNTTHDIQNYLRLREDLINKIEKRKKLAGQIFPVFSVKENGKYRGYQWREFARKVQENQEGEIYLAEVPSHNFVEEGFLEVLKELLEEAKIKKISLEILITCRAKGPLYQFLNSEISVSFRKNLPVGYMMQNPFTKAYKSSTKNKFMAVIEIGELFNGIDFEALE